MYISLDNIVYSRTWLLFRLILYTVDITTARTFHMYISLIFHDYDQILHIYISLVFGIFRLLLCMFNELFLVITFIISLHISSHHLTVLYSYWDFLGSFSGSNTVVLMFFLCFPYFSLSYMWCAHLYIQWLPPASLRRIKDKNYYQSAFTYFYLLTLRAHTIFFILGLYTYNQLLRSYLPFHKFNRVQRWYR